MTAVAALGAFSLVFPTRSIAAQGTKHALEASQYWINAFHITDRSLIPIMFKLSFASHLKRACGQVPNALAHARLILIGLTVSLTSLALAEDPFDPTISDAVKDARQPVTEATALFAGGCFWCLEPPFDKTPGVLETTVGYAGGRDPTPTYKEVSGGDSGHIEVIQVRYDPRTVSYESLLDIFWRNIDPFDGEGQFCDKGEQYISAVFTSNAAERGAVQADLQALRERFNKPIQTILRDAATFYQAETYHQDYYLKNPKRYKYYRWGCGRDKRLKKVWGREAGGLASK